MNDIERIMNHLRAALELLRSLQTLEGTDKDEVERLIELSIAGLKE